MGDLGMHVCHVPFRAGGFRKPFARCCRTSSRATDGCGGMAPCETWDNATLLGDAVDPAGGEPFPMTLRRSESPGRENTWCWSARQRLRSILDEEPEALELLDYSGGEQVLGPDRRWLRVRFKTITGGIFEFGFCDSILQMWAAFLHELEHGRGLAVLPACVTPEETALSNRLSPRPWSRSERRAAVAGLNVRLFHGLTDP